MGSTKNRYICFLDLLSVFFFSLFSVFHYFFFLVSQHILTHFGFSTGNLFKFIGKKNNISNPVL